MKMILIFCYEYYFSKLENCKPFCEKHGNFINITNHGIECVADTHSVEDNDSPEYIVDNPDEETIQFWLKIGREAQKYVANSNNGKGD